MCRRMRSDFLANTLVHSKREGKGKAVGAGGREREQDSGQVILPSGRSLASVSPSCLVSSSPDRAGPDTVLLSQVSICSLPLVDIC